jgi:hypothetical protein
VRTGYSDEPSLPWLRRSVAARATEVRVRTQVSLYEVFGGQSDTESFGFALRVSLPSSLSACCYYRKDIRAEPGNLPKSSAVTEIGELCLEMLVENVLTAGSEDKLRREHCMFLQEAD